MPHTTNYHNVFIEVAPDSPVESAEAPPHAGTAKSVARLQFELISAKPYQLTSDEVMFQVHVIRNGIPEHEWPTAREEFFAKARPCMRSSPLGKRYGWGVHADRNGRLAIYAVESDEYRRLATDEGVERTRAMRTRRPK